MNAVGVLAQEFQGVLIEAQGTYMSRNEMVMGPDGQYELEWIGLVREKMHREVNRLRAERSLPDVPMRLVEVADRQASGHSDYGRKFSLYCAELVLDISRRQY